MTNLERQILTECAKICSEGRGQHGSELLALTEVMNREAMRGESTYGMMAQSGSHASTLRDRLKRQIEAHSRESHRVKTANELFDLLEKNPDVARILELLEEQGVGG
jgi:hypothetical protein